MSPGLRLRHIGPHAATDFSLFTSRHHLIPLAYYLFTYLLISYLFALQSTFACKALILKSQLDQQPLQGMHDSIDFRCGVVVRQTDAEHSFSFVQTQVSGEFIRVVVARPNVDSLGGERLSKSSGSVTRVGDGDGGYSLLEPLRLRYALDLNARYAP
jgi:hypothetical protein